MCPASYLGLKLFSSGFSCHAIHVSTFFRASAAPLSILPWWYSFVEGVLLYPAFAVAVWRLGYTGKGR